ncbi:MAG: alpha/beta fold hydrolase [Deltaproteobacteria bacterium]|nr:alpha/beta fold hydrolase [Deltaproteobacteria bacterium]
MSPVRRLFGDPTSGSSPHASLRVALEETFAHFRERRPHPAVAALRAVVVLDDGTGDPWTVRIDDGRFSLVAGRARDAALTVESDPLTLAGMVRGKRSGIEAFLGGRLRVRGNLALALKLDVIFERRERRSNRARPHRVLAAGVDTFYLEAGSGPPVVLLHGLAATNASMLPTLAALSARHRVIAPDLPGFGDSEKPRAAYDPAFFATWLLAFLDAVGAEGAHLVGNSMGGRIALEAALLSPQRVGRLGLFSPSLAFRKRRQAVPLVRFLPPDLGIVPVPVLRVQIMKGLKLLFARPERLHDGWYEAAVDEFMRVFRTREGRFALYASARQIYLEAPFGPRGFWPRVEALRVPSLFIWGDRDLLVPAGFARHVEDSVPGARSVMLPECGHVPQFEHPERANALVAEFLAGAADVAPRHGAPTLDRSG